VLSPNSLWKWYFDTEMNSLMLDLGSDMIFRVALASKLLTPEAKISDVFNVDDMEAYQNIKENTAHLPLSDARKCELALNAVAARRFHKPVMPKSWFFIHQVGSEPKQGEVIQLTTVYGTAHYIIIENNGSASLCMLADVNSLSLDSIKKMDFCETIKVMNNRMGPYSIKESLDLALVG
jgi:cell division protein ZapC